MKWRKISSSILLATAFACLWVSACGGGAPANQVLVSVSPSGGTLVITQSFTFTAIVTGATDTSVTWTCTYTTQAAGATKPTDPVACTSDTGNISNQQKTTVMFTAPSTFPDPTKFPSLQIIITATSTADTKKSGKATITLDSGIRLQVTPATGTLATGDSLQFFAKDLTGTAIPNSKLKWDVTADATATTSSKTCTSTCGTISPGTATTGATYTAPASVPTQATATVFATSTVDPTRIGQATVTIVKAGDITFSGISPSVAPQGGLQQDVFLAATNATSQMGVKISGPNGDLPIQPSQIKVVFPPGSSASSIGARVRLKSDALAAAGHYTVQITPSNSTIKVLPLGVSFPLDISPVRPTIVGSTPDNFQEQNLGQTAAQGATAITIDGGYFGDPNAPTVAPKFNNGPALNSQAVATARRVTGFLPAPSGIGPTAGLYPLSVQYSTSPGPFLAPTATTAYTNIAVIPDYGGSNPPADVSGTPLSLVTNPPVKNAKVYVGPAPLISLAPSSVPSAIAMDPADGLAVVTLAGTSSNNVQFINLSSGTPTLTASLVSSGGNVATSVAVDDQLNDASGNPAHVAAVVNYASRSLSILQIPSGAPVATVDLSQVIPAPNPPSTSFVAPYPYSVGIDPFSHRALVAFASTNVGLIVNLDPTLNFNSAMPNPHNCILSNTTPPYCPIAYVTLLSGANPQVAFESGAHLTYVTPGGAGLLSGVDLAHPSTASSKGAVAIASAKRASNVVTITTVDPINLNPGNPGTVLISGLPAGNNKTNFDGSFAVINVIDANNFQYFQADVDDSVTGNSSSFANSGTPFLTYTISPSITGIAFSPVTRNAVLADPNVTFGQVSFIDTQSQSVTSMSLFAEATGAVSSGSPELGATTVAFQPFSNTAVSFNPKSNEVSLLDPSLLQRPAIVQTNQTGLATVCAANCSSTTPANVTIPGAIGVDSVNNLALAVNSGSGNITVFKLGSIKKVHIERVLGPAIDNSTVTTPANLTPAVKITLGAAPTAVGPMKIFGTGFTSLSQVRLDGTALPNCPTPPTPGCAVITFVGSRELDVTFPAGFFTAPRHYALDVSDSTNGGSNVVDFTVLEEVLLPACSGTAAAPGGVAIDEVNNLAVVTNTGSGCNQVSVISLDPAKIFRQTVNTIPTAATPTAVAVLPQLAYTGQSAGTSGVAVVTNNSANTVSILDLVNLTPVNDASKNPINVAVGTSPSGVAIDQETNLAVIANTGSNTVSTIDLTPLTASPIGKLTPTTVPVDQNPIAVAIDPDRGSNGRGLAVVTGLQLNGANPPFGVLDAIDIGGSTPSKLTSASVSGIQATPTGIVFDPAVSPALFYVTSSQANQITTFNPDTGSTQPIKVGINPNAIAYNFQTGTILTVNALSNTISVVDSQTFRTKATLGIGAASKFAAAIQTSTNLAVIADQANNRVLLFPLPK